MMTTLTEDQLWEALGARGFDPGYQEYVVTFAAAAGEHWSNLDNGDGAHVHITANDDGTYELADAGPDCPLSHT